MHFSPNNFTMNNLINNQCVTNEPLLLPSRLDEDEEIEHCASCNKPGIEQGISFCNANCEKMFNVGEPPAGWTVFSGTNLFEALDVNSTRLFVEGNLSNRACRIVLELTNFQSPVNVKETNDKLKQFAITYPCMVLKETAKKMFYKCHYSEEFDHATIHIKIHYQEPENPVIEFRKINGCSEIFSKIYVSFQNYILQENKPIPTIRPPPLTTVASEPTSIKTIKETISYMASNPESGIKHACMVAVENKIDVQIIMFNEIHNFIHRRSDIKTIAAQILGVADFIQTNPKCLLDDDHKKLIIFTLKKKIRTNIYDQDINTGIRCRMNAFIEQV